MHIYSNGDALRRREEILRIVGETPVHSQDELLTLLTRRGFKVTQPTLSRDLRELGLIKTPSGYVAPEQFGQAQNVALFTPRELREERFEQLVRDAVISATAAMNMVIIKTPVAAAQPVASAIDSTSMEDILGTIGGDDTVFVALSTPAAAAAFARRIQQIAGLTPARRRTRA